MKEPTGREKAAKRAQAEAGCGDDSADAQQPRRAEAQQRGEACDVVAAAAAAAGVGPAQHNHANVTADQLWWAPPSQAHRDVAPARPCRRLLSQARSRLVAAVASSAGRPCIAVFRQRAMLPALSRCLHAVEPLTVRWSSRPAHFGSCSCLGQKTPSPADDPRLHL